MIFTINNDYYNLSEWLDRLNPDILSTKPFKDFPSKREKYYSYASKAYLELGDYEKSIEISKKALESLSNFKNKSDIWFKWRIAKANIQLCKYQEALKYLEELYKYKKDWFVQKEIAECYFMNGDLEKSLKYAVDGALNFGDIDKKLNLYTLLEDILDSMDLKEKAIKHAYLVYSIRLKNQWTIDDELVEKIEKANFDLDNNDYFKIEKDLRHFWQSLKFKNQQKNHGTVTKILPHGKAGFIKSDDGNSYYFSLNQYKVKEAKLVKVYVSFYLEDAYDAKKDKKTQNAVQVTKVEI